ncbi:MAG TPA: hypothetical protein VEV17_24200 [Bryobacteraceae bacterium]|nr:hypothetical protein [Bryobacteraceae bacterium]
MFRFRWWLLCAAMALGPSLKAIPPLTTIEDALFTADGNRFNGLMTISWQSFQASDGSNIAAEVSRIQITNGILYVQLVPTTNANTPAIYTVQYNSNSNITYSEAWAVPPSTVPLRVADVRLAPGTVTGSVPPAASTSVQITDVVGLQSALTIRPTEGAGFSIARAAVINATGSIDGATGNLSDCLHVDGTSGACGSASATTTGTFVDAEAPGGTLDGVNATFTLMKAPNPALSLQIFRNGLLLRPGGDFTLSANSLTFLAGAIPAPGDALFASYRVGVALSGIGFVDMESPAGSIDGVNASFTLSQVPNPSGSLALYRNGIRLESALDYSTLNNAITFAARSIPQAGDVLLCSYRIAQ